MPWHILQILHIFLASDPGSEWLEVDCAYLKVFSNMCCQGKGCLRGQQLLAFDLPGAEALLALRLMPSNARRTSSIPYLGSRSQMSLTLLDLGPITKNACRARKRSVLCHASELAAGSCRASAICSIAHDCALSAPCMQDALVSGS